MLAIGLFGFAALELKTQLTIGMPWWFLAALALISSAIFLGYWQVAGWCYRAKIYVTASSK